MTAPRVGTVYKIVCGLTNEVYIGSTFGVLRNRFTQHKHALNHCVTKDWFAKHGVANFKILAIKSYAVADTEGLRAYEQLWLNKHSQTAINRYLAVDFFCKKCQHGALRTRCTNAECADKAVGVCQHQRRSNQCFEPECIKKASCLCPCGRQKLHCKVCSPVVCEKCEKTYAQAYLKRHQKTCK